MKTAVAVVFCLVALLAVGECQVAFTRISLYNFPAGAATCNTLLALRRALVAKSCPRCIVTPTVWNGPAVGYTLGKDFNCAILTGYPSAAVFAAYQTVEKANVQYENTKKLATLNGNFMRRG